MGIMLQALTHVWYAGRIIEPGEAFSAEESFGKKLILGKSAKVYKAVEKTQSTPDPVKELEKRFMALKLEELKELAEKNDVELAPQDNTKGEITKKLIEAGVQIG